VTRGDRIAQARRRWRLLVMASAVLAVLLLGLWLAYRAVQQRLAPGGPRIVYRVERGEARECAEALRRLVRREGRVIWLAGRGDRLEVRLPPVSQEEVRAIRARIESSDALATRLVFVEVLPPRRASRER